MNGTTDTKKRVEELRTDCEAFLALFATLLEEEKADGSGNAASLKSLRDTLARELVEFAGIDAEDVEAMILEARASKAKEGSQTC